VSEKNIFYGVFSSFVKDIGTIFYNEKYFHCISLYELRNILNLRTEIVILYQDYPINLQCNFSNLAAMPE
jgi:hypothetical protein